MRIVTFLIWVGLAPVGLAGWDAGVQGRVETAVGGFMDKHRVPGMSVAVVDGGELVWEAGFGVADLENDVPATAKTVYRLASISKAVTAVAAMKLAEEGKLDLDRPVGESVDAWPQEHAALTVRQLLGHTAGVRHYRPLEAFRTTHSASLESALDIFKDDALLSQPGTKYRYSTYGYTLAGRAMEVAAGKRLWIC